MLGTARGLVGHRRARRGLLRTRRCLVPRLERELTLCLHQRDRCALLPHSTLGRHLRCRRACGRLAGTRRGLVARRYGRSQLSPRPLSRLLGRRHERLHLSLPRNSDRRLRLRRRHRLLLFSPRLSRRGSLALGDHSCLGRLFGRRGSSRLRCGRRGRLPCGRLLDLARRLRLSLQVPLRACEPILSQLECIVEVTHSSGRKLAPLAELGTHLRELARCRVQLLRRARRCRLCAGCTLCLSLPRQARRRRLRLRRRHRSLLLRPRVGRLLRFSGRGSARLGRPHGRLGRQLLLLDRSISRHTCKLLDALYDRRRIERRGLGTRSARGCGGGSLHGSLELLLGVPHLGEHGRRLPLRTLLTLARCSQRRLRHRRPPQCLLRLQTLSLDFGLQALLAQGERRGCAIEQARDRLAA